MRRRRIEPDVRPPTSWVYFAEVGPYIKVGYSTDPERRVRRLFSSATGGPLGVPRDIASRRLLRTIPGTKSDEARVHDALSDFRVETEWYLDEPEVRAFIEAVEAGTYPHVLRPAGVYEPSLTLTPEAEADLARRVATAQRRHARRAAS